MAYGATRGKAKDILPHGRVTSHEGEGSAQLASATSNVHAQPVAQTSGDEPGAADEVQAGDEGAHHVVGAHHLGAAVGAEGLEDVVLGAVGEAVEEQVDAEQEQAPGRVGLVVVQRLALLLVLARVQREDGDARRHGRHHEVLVQRVAPAEEGDVQEHDGQQLATLGQQECDVVNVRKAGVAKGAGEAARHGHQRQRPEDAARRDDGRHRASARRRREQVDGSNRRRQDRLDRIKEDGEVPYFGRFCWSVLRRRQLLLEIGPSQERGVDASHGYDQLYDAGFLLLCLLSRHRCRHGAAIRLLACSRYSIAVGSRLLLAIGLLPACRLLVEKLGRRLALDGRLFRPRHCDSRFRAIAKKMSSGGK